MDRNGHNTRPDTEHAFNRGMWLALGIALIPVMTVAAALFLSGYEPADFNAHLRYVLLGMWLLFLFTVNRLATADPGRMLARLPEEQRGQILTILVFSALLGGLRLQAGMGALEMLREWFVGFVVLLIFLLALHSMFTAIARSWRRNRARARRHHHPGGGTPA